MNEITVQPFEEFEAAALPVVKPYRSKFGAVWFHEAGNRPVRREWLVKDLLLARSLGIIYGPPGCGKSFLITDLMLTCAAAVLPDRKDAREWFGYRVNPFGVVYVVAEGADDFVIRLHAWRQSQAIDVEDVIPFVFLPTSIDLRSSEADAESLIEEIKGIDREMREACGVGVGAVIIDTVSRALAGGNENQSDVMGAFIENCGRIQKETETAVICVHHGGKEQGRGPRGHESLLGAADLTIEVRPRSEERATNQFVIMKMKAGAGGAQHNFVLRPRTIDYDDDMDPITSCVVVGEEAVPEAEKKKKKGFSPNNGELEFLRALAETIDKSGKMPSPELGAPPYVTLVAHAEEVRALYKQRYAITEEGDAKKVEEKLRQRWGRATKSLIKFKVIEASDPWIWFTGRPIQGLKPRGIAANVKPDNTPVEHNSDRGDAAND